MSLYEHGQSLIGEAGNSTLTKVRFHDQLGACSSGQMMTH